MERTDPEFEPTLDLFLFGALLKRIRLNLGYRRAEDFVDAIKELTGLEVSSSIVYRMERGEREPTINFLVALNLMQGKPPLSTSMLDMCVPQEWKSIEDESYGEPYCFDDFMSNLQKKQPIPF